MVYMNLNLLYPWVFHGLNRKSQNKRFKVHLFLQFLKNGTPSYGLASDFRQVRRKLREKEGFIIRTNYNYLMYKMYLNNFKINIC